MNNASLTRTWAHARPVRIAARIPPGLDDDEDDAEEDDGGEDENDEDSDDA